MKKITVDNYEAWFLDYIEGRLDAEAKLELESFLLLHPYLKEELEQTSSFQLTPDSSSFEHKDELKKFQFEKQAINAATFNDFCIAAHEGLLTEKKKEELSNYMQTDAALFNEYIAFGKAFLKPEDIVFCSKDKLYRKVETANRRAIYMWASIAAGLALLFSIYSVFFNGKTEQSLQTADIPNKIKIEPQVKPEEKKIAIVKSIVIQQRSEGIKVTTPVKAETMAIANIQKEVEAEPLPQHEPEQVVVATIEPTNNTNTKTDTISASATEQTVEPVKASDKGEKRKLLALMEEGIEKINKVTHSNNLALAHQTSSTGEIKSFRIKLGFIGFERKKAGK